MATETWEIETGPVSGDVEYGFVDVYYSIRYPRGTFEVRQRVRSSSEGYAEAYKRVERIVTAMPRLDESFCSGEGYCSFHGFVHYEY